MREILATFGTQLVTINDFFYPFELVELCILIFCIIFHDSLHSLYSTLTGIETTKQAIFFTTIGVLPQFRRN